jgi:hypothetical protein
VIVAAVLEVIVNSMVLHEPACKSEIRLPILHAVFHPLVLLRQPVIEVALALLLEDLLDDLGCGFIMEDPAVRPLG